MSFHKPDMTFGPDITDSLLTHAGMTSETLSLLRPVPQAETPLKSLSLKSALVPGPSQAALGLGDQDAALLISSLDEKKHAKQQRRGAALMGGKRSAQPSASGQKIKP